ncbi:MAG: carbohydrate-binding protein, partial [Fibrobacter sp.]|nr:carbohydrate-binding protein [Fibrobacter sp.]
IAVPAASAGENNFDEYNEVEAKVNLTEGEHILRFTVTGDWMDIDYINFCDTEKCEDKTDLAAVRLNTFESENSYNVFSATGKHLGRVDLNGSNVGTALKKAGFARGVYMVRSVKGYQIQRVRIGE